MEKNERIIIRTSYHCETGTILVTSYPLSRITLTPYPIQFEGGKRQLVDTAKSFMLLVSGWYKRLLLWCENAPLPSLRLWKRHHIQAANKGLSRAKSQVEIVWLANQESLSTEYRRMLLDSPGVVHPLEYSSSVAIDSDWYGLSGWYKTCTTLVTFSQNVRVRGCNSRATIRDHTQARRKLNAVKSK